MNNERGKRGQVQLTIQNEGRKCTCPLFHCWIYVNIKTSDYYKSCKGHYYCLPGIMTDQELTIYMEHIVVSAIQKRELDPQRWDSEFGNRVKKICDELKNMFEIEPLLEGSLEDSTKFIAFALPNRLGQTPPNSGEDNRLRSDPYWKNSAELAISHLGDVVCIREDTNMKQEDLEHVLELIQEYRFIHIPWHIMKLKPSPSVETYWDTWWDAFFYYY